MKKWLIYLLCGVLCLSMVACAKDKQEDSTPDVEGGVKEETYVPDEAVNRFLHIAHGKRIMQASGILMEKGIRIDYGNKIGKTIIFASNGHGVFGYGCTIFALTSRKVRTDLGSALYIHRIKWRSQG